MNRDKQTHVPDDLYLIAGDYEEATDHIDWNRARLILDTYLETAFLNTHYATTCVSLLLSPRHFEEKWIDDWTSRRGCLMGEPGTKVVLTILTKVAETLAR